jgi:hypothetical protein
MTILILSFLGVFAVVLVAVSIGWSVVEAQRKKKVVGMLETVSGKTAAAETTVLKEAGGDSQDVLSRLVSGFDSPRNCKPTSNRRAWNGP